MEIERELWVSDEITDDTIANAENAISEDYYSEADSKVDEVVIHPLLDEVESEGDGWETNEAYDEPEDYFWEVPGEGIGKGVLVDDK